MLITNKCLIIEFMQTLATRKRRAKRVIERASECFGVYHDEISRADDKTSRIEARARDL